MHICLLCSANTHHISQSGNFLITPIHTILFSPLFAFGEICLASWSPYIVSNCTEAYILHCPSLAPAVWRNNGILSLICVGCYKADIEMKETAIHNHTAHLEITRDY